MCVV
jgi:hypothetical protein